MAGATWNDPIIISGLSGTIDVNVVDSTPFIMRWDGPYEQYAGLVIGPTTPASSASFVGYRSPPADPTSPASTFGVNQLPSTGGFLDDGMHPIWVRAFPIYTGTLTIAWSVSPSPGSRPYLWETAQDIDPLVGTQASYSLVYDNVGAYRFGERHYLLTPAAGKSVSIDLTPSGAYLDVYVQTVDPMTGAYLGWARSGSSPHTFNWIADGRQIHLYLYPPSTMASDGSQTGTVNISIQDPAPPPAYTVTNDSSSTPIALDLSTDGSHSYDNTGATKSASTLNLVGYPRDIWYSAPAVSTDRWFRLTTLPSDADPSRKVYIRVMYKLPSATSWSYPQVGLATNQANFKALAGYDMLFQLYFPDGNQGIWETAGTLSWTDVTASIPADSDPAMASSPTSYASAITMPDLGSMTVIRYLKIVGNGSPINMYLGDPSLPPQGYFYGYVRLHGQTNYQQIPYRSTSNPTGYIQLGTQAGQVVELLFQSRNGFSATLNYGFSTAANLRYTTWIDTYQHVDGFKDLYTVDAGPLPDGTNNYPTTKSWSSSSYLEGKTAPAGGIDVSLYAPYFQNGIDQLLANIAPSNNGGNGLVPSGWSHSGLLWVDPADARTLTQVRFALNFGAVSFLNCFISGGSGGVKFLPSTLPNGGTYHLEEIYPLYKLWPQVLAQMPQLTGPFYAASTVAEAVLTGRVKVEWSQDLGYMGKPYRPQVNVRSSAHVHASASPPPGAGATDRPLLTATTYADPERIGETFAVSEAAADAFAASPNLGGGRTTVLVQAANSFDYDGLAVEYTEEIVGVEAGWFVSFSDGRTLTARQPLDAQAMADYAVANNWGAFGLYGPQFELTGSASTEFNLELKWPSQFRIGVYDPYFGDPIEPPAPAPGTLLSPAPNLDGLGDGVRVTFS